MQALRDSQGARNLCHNHSLHYFDKEECERTSVVLLVLLLHRRNGAADASHSKCLEMKFANICQCSGVDNDVKRFVASSMKLVKEWKDIL